MLLSQVFNHHSSILWQSFCDPLIYSSSSNEAFQLLKCRNFQIIRNLEESQVIATSRIRTW